MSRIIAQKIGSKLFDFNKKTNTFVADASDLPKTFNPLSQVFDDNAGDNAGFIMVSAKTGDELIFSFTHTDGEEDVAGWNFIAYPTGNQKHLHNIKVLIIND